MTMRSRYATKQQLAGASTPSPSSSKVHSLLKDRFDAAQSLALIGNSRKSSLVFSPSDEERLNAGLEIKECFEARDTSGAFRRLSGVAFDAKLPIANLQLLEIVIDFGEAGSDILKGLKPFLLAACLYPIKDDHLPYGFDLFPFSHSLTMGLARLFVLSNPNLLRQKFGSGGMTTGTNILLPSRAEIPARHELQHLTDYLVKPRDYPRGVEATLKTRIEFEYRAKLAEIIAAPEPFQVVLAFRLSMVSSKIGLLKDLDSQDAHRAAEKKILFDFDGIPKVDMRQRAVELLDQSYKRWVGVSLTEIFEHCEK